MISVKLDGDRKEYAPGGIVSGEISWMNDQPPESVTVRLFWFTDGRGSRNVGIADEFEVSAPNASDTERFTLTVPPGPYTCSGSLVSIQWAVEAVVNKGESNANAEITVSPWVETLKLSALPKD